jgi:TolB protein
MKVLNRALVVVVVWTCAVAGAAGSAPGLGRAGPDYAFDVFVMRADGTDVRALTRTRGVDDHSPAWSPSGRTIAFVRFSPTASFENDIWTVRRDGRGSRLLVREPGWAVSLSYSPNGRQLVYRNSWVGHSGSISVASTSGGTGTALVSEPPGRYFVSSPSWSPDGRTIAFNRGRNDGFSTIQTVPSSGGNATELGRGSRPIWSPNGKSVLYQNGFKIWVMGADGAGARAIAPADRYANAEWSPDGRTIAYQYRGGIYVIPSTGGQPRRVAKSGSQPAWAPDSRRILFRDRATLYIGDRATTPPRSLGVPVGQVATWSPDGRWIAFDASAASVQQVG